MRRDLHLADLDRRLASIGAKGVVREVDLAAARVRVDVAGGLTDWIPWLVTRAGSGRTWWAPEVGEQVGLLAPDGDLGNAFVLGSLYQQSRPAPADTDQVVFTELPGGGSVEYDREAGRLRVELPPGDTVEIVATGGLHLVGDLSVEGTVEAAGDVYDSVASMAQGRTLYNQHTHVAPSGGGTTAPPVPLQGAA